MDLQWGKTWKYYDLASLTKIMFTVPFFIRLVQEKKLKLTDSATQYLGGIKGSGQIQHLLSHCAGNAWWKPFYEDIPLDQNIEMRKIRLREQLKGTHLRKSSTAVYSDIDFFILGFILEDIREKSWQDLSLEIAQEFYHDNDLFFIPKNKTPQAKKLFAPTEKSLWRGKMMCGEVHDENAWALGGVAPHAGLFGTTTAVSQWGLKIRGVYKGQNKMWLSPETLRRFSRRYIQDWSLGFMMPTYGSSSAGKYFSMHSFGHTGFTGTSWWYDPQQDLMITLISNRIHPNRANNEFRNWRPMIHNWVCESLTEL